MQLVCLDMLLISADQEIRLTLDLCKKSKNVNRRDLEDNNNNVKVDEKGKEKVDEIRD